MDKFETTIREQLIILDTKMKKGKGVWPEHGYIQDKEWDTLTGAAYALRRVLRECE